MVRLVTAYLSIVAFSVVTPVSSAQDLSTQEDFLRNIYPSFSALEYFGSAQVIFKGDGAEELGLDVVELTDFLRLKYKNTFAGFPYRNIIDNPSPNLFEQLSDDDFSGRIGSLVATVWIVGTDYPIAYHIELRAGSFNSAREYSDAALGYGSKENVPATVKTALSDMMDDLAITFLKVRGEL